jgi:hypothetical protein
MGLPYIKNRGLGEDSLRSAWSPDARQTALIVLLAATWVSTIGATRL